ncbi:NFACT family protein [Staphylococcus aureus]
MVESLQFLTTGRVHKINQPDNDTILMVVRKIDKTINCYCRSIQTLRLQLTTKKYDNPFNPAIFRVFRKTLRRWYYRID